MIDSSLALKQQCGLSSSHRSIGRRSCGFGVLVPLPETVGCFSHTEERLHCRSPSLGGFSTLAPLLLFFKRGELWKKSPPRHPRPPPRPPPPVHHHYSACSFICFTQLLCLRNVCLLFLVRLPHLSFTHLTPWTLPVFRHHSLTLIMHDNDPPLEAGLYYGPALSPTP